MKITKGRGAISNSASRYDSTETEDFDDGWGVADNKPPPLQTTVTEDSSRSIITRNRSPDIPFDRSINPYRGCEHGCVYCYARPTHAYLGLSPGLDFESRLLVKPGAADLLRHELNKKSYRCRPIALGSNTDPYQPIERKWGVTREILQVLQDYRHPVTVVTKSSLIERDLDVLRELADNSLVLVMISICTLDRGLARNLEPRAASPQRRVETIRTLSAEGIPVGTMVAPVIPVLNDIEIEKILEIVAKAGALTASYVLLRLPLEVRPLFEEWLSAHYPLKKSHIMSRIRDVRNGKVNESQFGSRMTGTGHYAGLIRQRFSLASRRFGLNKTFEALNTDAFRSSSRSGEQLSLF